MDWYTDIRDLSAADGVYMGLCMHVTGYRKKEKKKTKAEAENFHESRLLIVLLVSTILMVGIAFECSGALQKDSTGDWFSTNKCWIKINSAFSSSSERSFIEVIH